MAIEERKPVEYLVKEKSLIGNELKEAGEKVFYAGLPSENLEPLCEEGRTRALEYKQSNDERVKKMMDNNKESGVGDPSQFVKQFADMMVQQQAEADAKFSALQKQNAELIALLMEQKTAPVPAAIVEQQAEADAAPAQPAVAVDSVVEDGTGDDTKPVKRTRG